MIDAINKYAIAAENISVLVTSTFVSTGKPGPLIITHILTGG